MQGYAIEKVEGGKLLRIKAEYDETMINQVIITGDFFLYPEDAIALLEQKCSNIERNFDVETLTNDLRAFVTRHEIELIGISPEAIAQTLKRAVPCGA